MSVKFVSFGANREVTGSTHMLEVDGVKMLVDCGMFQGKRVIAEQKNRQFLFDPATIETVVLTHGHCDHSCRLPYLSACGFRGNIYATPATRDIAGLIMADTAHIQEKDAEWMRKKKIYGEKEPFQPLFGIKDVLKVLEQFITISYRRDFFVADSIKCNFYDAGHILGSAMPVIDIGQGRKIAFTGDLGRKGTPIIRDPEQIPSADYLVCEATYGNRLHDPIEDACRQLCEVIRETVERGGKIIIPAFAVERTQDIIYYLHQLVDARKIPRIDIYVDSPMAFNATSIFRVHQECFDDQVREEFLIQDKNPFGFETLHYITNVAESKRLNEKDEPCIIISSSGMCEAGRILHHLKNNIEDPRNTILVVGFMAEDTLGRRIAEREPEVKIFGQLYKLKARVKILNTFSAHADYNDVKQFVGNMDLKRLRKVFLVHGEDEELEKMKGHLLGIGVKEVEIVDTGKEYPLYD
ncbi:MAG TPA: MBL fold metallo-hydrolase [Lentisphaeria bacterium]|nr:MAG: MBL fold metallo-hydrolase [Lentisphaerae bacterium GWF2_50_93]HCE42036.1 MBL fold metallo-hydrolase [Lentisphaeria bacterium]